MSEQIQKYQPSDASREIAKYVLETPAYVFRRGVSLSKKLPSEMDLIVSLQDSRISRGKRVEQNTIEQILSNPLETTYLGVSIIPADEAHPIGCVYGQCWSDGRLDPSSEILVFSPQVGAVIEIKDIHPILMAYVYRKLMEEEVLPYLRNQPKA